MSTACVDFEQWTAGHLGNQSGRYNYESAERYGRQCRDLRFEIEISHAFLEPRLQVVGAAGRFLRVEAGVGFPGLFLRLQILERDGPSNRSPL